MNRFLECEVVISLKQFPQTPLQMGLGSEPEFCDRPLVWNKIKLLFLRLLSVPGAWLLVSEWGAPACRMG